MKTGKLSRTLTKDEEAARLAKLDKFLVAFEISVAEAQDLVTLEDYEVVVIADDSGSMRTSSVPADQRVLGAPKTTRWDELKKTVAQMVDIASCFDDTGVDVYFLNREPVLAVKHSTDEKFMEAFKGAPSGSTPLTETLHQVAPKFKGERPLLLFILTDGEPNGGRYNFINALRTLTSETAGHRLHVQIMACTADDTEIGWLESLDRELAAVDVTDDYHTEKKQVLVAGLAPKFTRGDWCMKAMLGPVSSKFDRWDESLHPLRIGQCGAQCGCMVQ